MGLIRAFTLFLLVAIGACNGKNPNITFILIETSFGNIKIKLYDDTPIHKHNFIKLVNSNYYNGTLFHRVINNFMIQGGDPQSKNAAKGVLLGNGDTGYTLPAEILPNHFHKRGVLAAAREGDDINPEKRSSGGQFYLVQGRKFTDEQLNELEQKLNQSRFQSIVSRIYLSKRDSLIKSGFDIPNDTLISQASILANKLYKPLHFSNEQRKIYNHDGGVPHLDGAYTVFGEVAEGIEVIDKIASVATDNHDRPLEDIRMTIKIIQ
jgi:peptidylprolyl isomerase